MPDFSAEKLGDTYKDSKGKKWTFKALCTSPTVVLVDESGEEIVVSVDSRIAQGLVWYRRAEANG